MSLAGVQLITEEVPEIVGSATEKDLDPVGFKSGNKKNI